MSKKKEELKLDKESFIEFISQASPEEINRTITEYGKPTKLYSPIFFAKDEENNN